MNRIIKYRPTHEQYYLIRKKVEEIGQEECSKLNNQQLRQKISEELGFDVGPSTIGDLVRNLGWKRKKKEDPVNHKQLTLDLLRRVEVLEKTVLQLSQGTLL